MAEMSFGDKEKAWVLKVYRTNVLNLGWVVGGLVCTILRALGAKKLVTEKLFVCVRGELTHRR